MRLVVNKRDVCGEFPEFCYRAFKCEEYAKQFVENGIFRMGCILSYRASEDQSRRDTTEGTGHTIEPGIVTYHGFSKDLKDKPVVQRKLGYQHHTFEQSNRTYCFCTSLPRVDFGHMKCSFGKYIVKITDPRKLAEDINDFFWDQQRKFLIEGCYVVYNKGQELDRKLEDNERLDLAYMQKPQSFESDCEFRIVSIGLGDVYNSGCKFLYEDWGAEPACKFIDVNLERALDYVCLV